MYHTETGKGGYKEKLFTAATQHIKVGKPNSDCGTTKTMTVTLTKKNIQDWMYSFYKSGSKLVEITSENMNSLVGKTVNMRFSALCKEKNGYICEKCAGSLFRRIGIENVGMGSMIMMSSLKNANMKKFHDSTVKLSHIDPNDVFDVK